MNMPISAIRRTNTCALPRQSSPSRKWGGSDTETYEGVVERHGDDCGGGVVFWTRRRVKLVRLWDVVRRVESDEKRQKSIGFEAAEARLFVSGGGIGKWKEEGGGREGVCGQFWWAELAPIKTDGQRHRLWL